MNILSKIFDVFSNRQSSSTKQKHIIPSSTRNRLFLWCVDIFSGSRAPGNQSDYRKQFWHEIYKFLQYRHGKLNLFEGSNDPADIYSNIYNYLNSCPGEEFIDFIEYIFRVDCFVNIEQNIDDMIDEINEIIAQDKLPYFLTAMIVEKVPLIVYPSTIKKYRMDVVAFPQIILKESETIHKQFIIPVLTLLQRPFFTNANKEYLDALEDYRKNDFGDCLTKCGSAFESVMKILCENKKWKYNKNDTAATLIKIMIDNMHIDTYFTNVLTIIATLRNRYSKAHGAGLDARNAKKSHAEYAINATASAILFLVAEAGER